MRATAWRPSTALRKRRSAYLSLLDASGVAALFVFFLAMYLMRSAVTDQPMHPSADLARAIHAKPLPAALKEDAIIVVVSRDGTLYFRDSRVSPANLPGKIRTAYQHGAERKVYLEADARAKYVDVEAAVDLVRQAGIQDVALIVQEARLPNASGAVP